MEARIEVRTATIEQDEILTTGEGLLLTAAFSAVVVSLLTFVLF